MNTFGKYLNQTENVKVLNITFYLTMLSRFGSAIVPDYALRYLDVGFDLNTDYYNGGLEQDILVLTDIDQIKEYNPNEIFEEDYRDVITREEKKGHVEKLEDDTLYVKVL